jgi:FkbM family methyltransferase
LVYASRIQIENIAVSDGTQSEVLLYPGRESSHAEWNIVGHDVEGMEKQAMLSVPAISLDNYFRSGSVLDFVKIDIEGAEALALSGMRRILRESRPIILIEFHDEAGWKGREELYAADYLLYDVSGNALDQEKDTQRVYHCMACPIEKKINEAKNILHC